MLFLDMPTTAGNMGEIVAMKCIEALLHMLETLTDDEQNTEKDLAEIRIIVDSDGWIRQRLYQLDDGRARNKFFIFASTQADAWEFEFLLAEYACDVDRIGDTIKIVDPNYRDPIWETEEGALFECVMMDIAEVFIKAAVVMPGKIVHYTAFS